MQADTMHVRPSPPGATFVKALNMQSTVAYPLRDALSEIIVSFDCFSSGTNDETFVIPGARAR